MCRSAWNFRAGGSAARRPGRSGPVSPQHGSPIHRLVQRGVPVAASPSRARAAPPRRPPLGRPGRLPAVGLRSRHAVWPLPHRRVGSVLRWAGVPVGASPGTTARWGYVGRGAWPGSRRSAVVAVGSGTLRRLPLVFGGRYISSSPTRRHRPLHPQRRGFGRCFRVRLRRRQDPRRPPADR